MHRAGASTRNASLLWMPWTRTWFDTFYTASKPSPSWHTQTFVPVLLSIGWILSWDLEWIEQVSTLSQISRTHRSIVARAWWRDRVTGTGTQSCCLCLWPLQETSHNCPECFFEIVSKLFVQDVGTRFGSDGEESCWDGRADDQG